METIETTELDVTDKPIIVEDIDEEESRRQFEAEFGNSPEESELKIACQQYLTAKKSKGGSASTLIDKIARLMFNDARVRKICRVVAMKTRVDLDEFDEVLQRVMEVFFSKTILKMRDADAVYAVAYAIARNVCREMQREASFRAVTHDSIEEMKEQGEEISEPGVFQQQEQEDADIALDQRLSIGYGRLSQAELDARNGELDMSTYPGLGIEDGASPFAAAEAIPFIDLVPAEVAPEGEDSQPKKPASSPQGRRKGGSRASLSSDQAELVRISDELGLRNQDFAVMLGIGLPRLSSYIYGRTASVPDEVMDRARQLLQEHMKTQEVKLAKFNRQMSEIVTEWEKRLKVTKNEELANLLGVTTMTVHRWKTNATRPDNTALVRYEQIVDSLEERMQAFEARLAASVT